MKKALLVTLLTLISLFCHAQNAVGIKFLGIPIDGPKEQFAQKLKAKDFTYSSLYESYKGQFNGKPVDVYIHTNHNLVDRVYVAFPYSTEEGIRTEFNRLLNQFKNNGKYMDLSFNSEIPDDEDISYEITVNNKRYQASFSYFDPDRDKVSFANDLVDKFLPYIEKEQAEVFKEYVRKLATTPESEQQALQEQMLEEMQKTMAESATEQDPEQSFMLVLKFIDAMKSLADGEVWFMIHEHYGKYQIGLYYDNLHNQAHGEDL